MRPIGTSEELQRPRIRAVADLIERWFAIYKRRLKWTSQKPQRKARERDEAAIAT